MTSFRSVLLILVMALAFETFLAKVALMIFSSSIPVRGIKASTYFSPCFRRKLLSVPSPWMISASGKVSERASQRF